MVLTAGDRSWADTLVYCAHDGLETVGRFPDGGSELYLMSKPTIGKANAMTMYNTLWKAPGHESGIGKFNVHTAGLSLTYSCDELLLKSEDDNDVSLTIYSLSGVTLICHALKLEGGHDRVSVADLPSGVYIAQLRNAQGDICSIKFRK